MTETPVKKKKGFLGYMRDNWDLYVMVLPAVAIIAVFVYWPMYGVVMAFQTLTLFKGLAVAHGLGCSIFKGFFQRQWHHGLS